MVEGRVPWIRVGPLLEAGQSDLVIPEYELSFLIPVLDHGLFLLSSNSCPAPKLTLKADR